MEADCGCDAGWMLRQGVNVGEIVWIVEWVESESHC